MKKSELILKNNLLMKESSRIISLFEKLYDGSPWIDVSIADSLKDISARQAAARALPGCNSIWELVNHLTHWRLNVLKRVEGKRITTPDNNYIEPITDTTDAAWKKTLDKLDESQQKWIHFLKAFKSENFSRIYPNNNMNYYEHIHGILQHDAYHLGQIVLLRKFV
jgi:uncharacterized damage-inducible protein DinB